MYPIIIFMSALFDFLSARIISTSIVKLKTLENDFSTQKRVLLCRYGEVHIFIF